MDTEKVEAKIVRHSDLSRELSEKFGKEYDVLKALGNPDHGTLHVMDFRLCDRSPTDVFAIDDWRDGGEQPSLHHVMNNLVKRGELPGGIYLVLVLLPEAW